MLLRLQPEHSRLDSLISRTGADINTAAAPFKIIHRIEENIGPHDHADRPAAAFLQILNRLQNIPQGHAKLDDRIIPRLFQLLSQSAAADQDLRLGIVLHIPDRRLIR